MTAFPVSRGASLLLLLVLACALAPAGAAGGDADSPDGWLGRMNRSVSTLSFEGDFVYLSGRSLEAMRLSHLVKDGRTRESLFSLTGQPREIIRDHDTLTIITWVDGKPQKVTHPSSGRLSPLKPLSADDLRRHYRLMMGKPARIAGRPGVVVALVPRDDLRYGYRITLDRESALPLDLTVMDDSGRLISRIMFTQLHIHDHPVETPPAAPAEPETETVAVAASAERHAGGEGKGGGWTFRTLPEGFRLVNRQYSSEGEQEHFVFSDGLATVSLYIEPLAEGDRPFRGKTSLGSVNAFGRLLGRHQLTVVGEVPHKTLRLLADAVQRQPD